MHHERAPPRGTRGHGDASIKREPYWRFISRAIDCPDGEPTPPSARRRRRDADADRNVSAAGAAAAAARLAYARADAICRTRAWEGGDGDGPDSDDAAWAKPRAGDAVLFRSASLIGFPLPDAVEQRAQQRTPDDGGGEDDADASSYEVRGVLGGTEVAVRSGRVGVLVQLLFTSSACWMCWSSPHPPCRFF